MKRLLKNLEIKLATKRTVGNMLPSIQDKINRLINAVLYVKFHVSIVHVFI